MLKNVVFFFLCGMYSCYNLALNYLKPNDYRFATAAFPKRFPMTFVMLKMEFMSAFISATVVLKIFSLCFCCKNGFLVRIARAVKIATLFCVISSE